MKERIAIIDHAYHTLFIEDIDTDMLDEKYNGEEEDYIKDNYTFEGEWSWDYINSAQYIADNGDVVDMDADINEYNGL